MTGTDETKGGGIMTRKDYVAIANAINRVHRNAEVTERYWIHETINAIGTALKKDNYKFNRTKFYCACTQEEKNGKV
jgi:hypothetical protein